MSNDRLATLCSTPDDSPVRFHRTATVSSWSPEIETQPAKPDWRVEYACIIAEREAETLRLQAQIIELRARQARQGSILGAISAMGENPFRLGWTPPV